VNFVERFKHSVVVREVGALVRSRPREVLHIPEAVELLVGDRFDSRRDIRVSHLKQGFASQLKVVSSTSSSGIPCLRSLLPLSSNLDIMVILSSFNTLAEHWLNIQLM